MVYPSSFVISLCLRNPMLGACQIVVVPSPGILNRLRGVLFRRTTSEVRVVPAHVEVVGWRKEKRRGMVARGAGGPAGETIRAGDRVPWGAKADHAYRAGYDGRGVLSFETVAVPGCSAMLVTREAGAA